jgi:hypothetical protein
VQSNNVGLLVTRHVSLPAAPPDALHPYNLQSNPALAAAASTSSATPAAPKKASSKKAAKGAKQAAKQQQAAAAATAPYKTKTVDLFLRIAQEFCACAVEVPVVADAALQGARVLTWMEAYVSAGRGVRICELEIGFCKLVAWALEVDTEGAAGRLEASPQQHGRRAKGLAKQVRGCASWHSTHTWMLCIRPPQCKHRVAPAVML